MISDEKIAELKAAHGEVYVATINGFDFAFSPPKSWAMAARKFMQDVGEDKRMLHDAGQQLAFAATVYPSKAELTALFDEWPLLSGPVSGELVNLAQRSGDARAKKA